MLSKLVHVKPGIDIKKEILELFLSKFLNFVRNPYSIKKVLATFPQVINNRPTDPEHYKNFKQVLKGKKPHQSYLCAQLGISEQEYVNWLGVIFLLLTELEEGKPNILEQLTKELFENKETFVNIDIHIYDEQTCLLSDRGYSIPLSETVGTAWDFNLYSHGFIRYGFVDIDLFSPKNAPKELVERFKSEPKSIHVNAITNDLRALKQYNQHVVYQCYRNVFNSSPEVSFY